MAYKIKYLPLAVQDLHDIAEYLSQFYPGTALRVLRMIRDKIANLRDMPEMYERYEQEPDYRKLPAEQYLVFYKVQEEKQIVEIHRILRASWNLPQYVK